MFTNAEFKDFMQEHETEILKNDWESIYNDLPSHRAVSKLTDFLLNKAHINTLFYMTSVPECFAENLDIKSVIIPNTVTSIGHRAFYNCTNLTSINIQDGVTSIGGSAFYNCTNLTSITIPNSVTTIGMSAFENCTSLTSITIPNSMKSIRNSAFYNCSSLTSITIPSSVESINDFAFEDCTGLTSVTIPSSVKKIRYHAFTGCNNLKEIKYTGNQQQWNKLLSLATNEYFAEWIREHKVKVIFI